MATLSIADQFDAFRKEVISPSAPDVQVNEMRMAFFAGASVVIAFTKVIADLPEARGIAILEELHREIDAFANAMPDGGTPT